MQIESRPIGQLAANCYILDKKIMIDPGDSVGELDAFLRDSRADIHAVIITHGHFDHMLGTSHIKKTCGAKVYISEPDAPSLWEEKVAACLPYGVTPFEPVQPDILLKEGSVEIEDIPFDVLLSPGHTPGGICLISKKDKAVFTGDTLFRFGYGRTDLYGGDELQLFRSLKRLFALPEDYIVYPGHGERATLREIAQGWR